MFYYLSINFSKNKLAYFSKNKELYFRGNNNILVVYSSVAGMFVINIIIYLVPTLNYWPSLITGRVSLCKNLKYAQNLFFNIQEVSNKNNVIDFCLD